MAAISHIPVAGRLILVSKMTGCKKVVRYQTFRRLYKRLGIKYKIIKSVIGHSKNVMQHDANKKVIEALTKVGFKNDRAKILRYALTSLNN